MWLVFTCWDTRIHCWREETHLVPVVVVCLVVCLCVRHGNSGCRAVIHTLSLGIGFLRAIDDLREVSKILCLPSQKACCDLDFASEHSSDSARVGVMMWLSSCPIIYLSYPFSAVLLEVSFSFCSFWFSSYAATSLERGWKLNVTKSVSTALLSYLKLGEKNSQVNVTAKVLEEFNLPLAEEEARFEWQRTPQSSVKASQDLSLVLRYVSTVFQLQQVQIEFWICLESHKVLACNILNRLKSHMAVHLQKSHRFHQFLVNCIAASNTSRSAFCRGGWCC